MGVDHDVTQRGKARQFILSSDAERTVYLVMLRQAVLYPLSLIGSLLDRNPFMAGKAAHVGDDYLVSFTESGLDRNGFHRAAQG